MDLREQIIAALIKAKIPSPRLEADIILKNAAPSYPEYSAAEEDAVNRFVKRRVGHEPLDKIIGRKEFYKYTFKVSHQVLSPRPDTEVLVEEALSLIPVTAAWQILDLGTGSGCILLSLLKEREKCLGCGVDVSAEALKIAAENALELGVFSRVAWKNISWEKMRNSAETYDIIVSNPPYIPRKDIESLETEVKNYDPLSALDGGEDGFDCYRQIASSAFDLLKKNGYILLEAGYNQAEEIMKIFASSGLEPVRIVADLANINRCVILKK